MHPKQIKIADYTYQLPDEKIAQFPLEERDASKLLVFNKGNLSEDIYKNIAAHIPSDSLVVFNQTKVVQVRLLFKKESGGAIEIFCLEPDTRYADMQVAMSQTSEVYWQCLVGGAQKWKNGQRVFLNDESFGDTISARIVDQNEGVFLIHFSWSNNQISFAEVLHTVGKVPLPPYMRRDMSEEDKDRYQTIYAQEEGSVAAPTAGLHFTPRIFESFKTKNIQPAFLTLHVGAGTFKQVKSESIGEHDMHAEWIELSLSFLEQLSLNLSKIVAIGTTSMRTLESLYWIGLKLYHKMPISWEQIAIGQWDPYELEADISVEAALEEIINWMKIKQIDKLITRTQIMIAPGYHVKVVNSLVTNFHQPNSTLLLLIAALVGDSWKTMYQHALDHNYRFLSYGDGCFIKF